MTRRTQSMYMAMLTTLLERASDLYRVDLAPRVVVTDFEKAAMNAFAEIFSNVTVNGCHFHLCQSVLRKVNAFGLKSTYERDAEFVCLWDWRSYQSLKY